MNKISFSLLLFAVQFSHVISANAASITVYAHGAKKLFVSSISPQDVGKSVGLATVNAFSQAANFGKLTFIGNPHSLQEINSIKPKVVSSSSIEQKAFGWCFAVNGNVINQAADTVMVSSKNEIIWFYGYVEQKHGVWKMGCHADALTAIALAHSKHSGR